MAEFLSRNRAEVLRTSIFEYDQEKHIKQEKEESWEEGLAQGWIEGKQSELKRIIGRKIEKGRSLEQIAADLEYSQEEIKPIYDMVKEEISGRYNVAPREDKKNSK